MRRSEKRLLALIVCMALTMIIWVVFGIALYVQRSDARSELADQTDTLTTAQQELRRAENDIEGMASMLAEKDHAVTRLTKINAALTKERDSLASEASWLEGLGSFKLTWYITDGIHTGYTTASGKPVGDHVIAMNRSDMKKYGLSWGDEIVVAYKRKVEWRVLLDTGCAKGVVDLYTTGKVPSWGVAPCNIFVKRTGLIGGGTDNE